MKNSRKWLLCLVPTALTMAMSGCGGGDSGGVQNPTPGPAGRRTFYSKFNSVLVGNSNLVDVARSFVTLEANSNVPYEVGLELTAKAVTDLPLPPNFNDPVIYGINLPPESVYTPFSYIAISYWSAHDPVGTGDSPHFHPLFGINPPQLPSAACGSEPEEENCIPEAKPAQPNEVPMDYIPGSEVPEAGIHIAPGIGIAYEDVVLPQPQLQPGWNTIGQNYFFYNGHVNAIGLGATNDYLLKQERGQAPAVPAAVYNIKQPEVFSKRGYYPRRYDVRYNAERKVHIFVLSDFRLATNIATP